MEQRKQTLTPQIIRKTAEDILAGKKTLANLRGLTKETMDACYSAAYKFYSRGNFINALNIFTTLCMFDNMNADYWLGLGMTRQMLEDFSGAVDAYSLAALLDNANPKAPFHAAACLIALKDYGKAKMALEAAIAIVKTSKTEDKEYKAIVERANNLLELMKKAEKGSKEEKGSKIKANKMLANKIPVERKK